MRVNGAGHSLNTKLWHSANIINSPVCSETDLHQEQTLQLLSYSANYYWWAKNKTSQCPLQKTSAGTTGNAEYLQRKGTNVDLC